MTASNPQIEPHFLFEEILPERLSDMPPTHPVVVAMKAIAASVLPADVETTVTQAAILANQTLEIAAQQASLSVSLNQTASTILAQEAAALAAVPAAAGSATAAAASATSAAGALSTMQAALAAFKAVFVGEFAADPTVDGNGNALMAGAEYFNTMTKKLRVYDGAAWGDYDATAQIATSNAVLAASNAAASAAAAANSVASLANGSLTDAGTLTGTETLPTSRGSGLLKTTVSVIANFVLSCFGVPSVSALRALDSRFFTRATTTGYQSIGVGAGSYYFVQTSSPPADNNVTVLRSNDGRGYWALIHNGVIDVKQAGALAGTDCSQAIRNALDAAIASNRDIERLVFSAMAGGYQFSNQVLFNASNITYELFADWFNNSTLYKTPWIFAYDFNAQPAQALSNIEIIGHGSQWHMNGGNIATAQGISLTALPASFPQQAINYIKRLRIHNTRFDDGVYDSLQLRQCQDHLVDACEFTGSKLYLANGLNVTTDFAAYVRGDWTTYSHGVVRASVAYNNASVGMTYYNCSGGTIEDCRSWNNGNSGYSYEAPPGGSTKYASGNIRNSKAFLNGINGAYITMNGVDVDAGCETFGNGTLGLANDPSGGIAGLQMCGVVVSGADDVSVLGKHANNARHGVTFLGATGLTPKWTSGGTYDGNAGSGINVQGLYRMRINPGTTLRNNGNQLINGQYTIALNVSNATYNTNAGILEADGLIFDGNGTQDVSVVYVDVVSVSKNISYNNNASRGAGGTGMTLLNIRLLMLQNNVLSSPNGNTTVGYNVGNTVSHAYVWGNKSDQTTGSVMINNADKKFGISSATKMTVGTFTLETALPSTGTATLSDVTNVLATLIEAQQDGLMQG